MDGSVDTNHNIVVHCEADTLRNQSLNHTLMMSIMCDDHDDEQ